MTKIDHDPIVVASYYRLTATIFRENAEILLDAYAKRDVQIPVNPLGIPLYFLFSHAIELLLKSALLKRGIQETKLKQYELRHDLEALASELENLGCVLSKSSKEVIVSLSTQHQSHHLRYTVLFEGTVTYMPKPDDAFAALDELLLATKIG
jgi:hypothetical protein